MKATLLACTICSLFIFGCSNHGSNEKHRHEHEDVLETRAHDHEHEKENSENEMAHNHEHSEKSGADHQHDSPGMDEHDHEGEEIKIQFTAYTNKLELFAEADPLVEGEPSHILAHFSTLPQFDPLEKAAVSLNLLVQGDLLNTAEANPVRPGIYGIDITPERSGRGSLYFIVQHKDFMDTVRIENVMIHKDRKAAIQEEEQGNATMQSHIVFTKEQSWKIDFATTPARAGSFGQVIKTTAQVQPAPEDQMVLSAKTNGIIQFIGNSTVEGQNISKGQVLFVVSGSGLAENNLKVRLAEAKSNFEQARINYERAQTLAAERIISEKEMLEARTRYENTKNLYENLSENFSSSGQKITASMSGFIDQLFVKNGEYVETGQPLASISQNKILLLHAYIQPKYASIAGNISSATLKDPVSGNTYTLNDLNGRILSVGRTTGSNSYLIPVTLLIENKAGFIPGSFTELYLQTETGQTSVIVPDSALLEEQGIFFVMVQITPELFEKRQVKIGASNGNMTEILHGVVPGERVVSEGAVMVKLAQASGTLDAHSGHVH